jgi:hypothetical protein
MGASILIESGAVAALQAGNLPLAIQDASHRWAAVPEGPGDLNHSHFHKGSNDPNAPGPFQPSRDYQFIVDTYHQNGGR